MAYYGSFAEGALKGYGFLHDIQRQQRQEERLGREEDRAERRLGMVEDQHALQQERLEWDKHVRNMTLAGQKFRALATDPKTGQMKAIDQITQADLDRAGEITRQHRVLYDFWGSNPDTDQDDPFAGYTLMPPTEEGGEPTVVPNVRMKDGSTMPVTWNRSSKDDDNPAAVPLSTAYRILMLESDPNAVNALDAETRKGIVAANTAAQTHKNKKELQELKNKGGIDKENIKAKARIEAAEIKAGKGGKGSDQQKLSPHNPQRELDAVNKRIAASFGGKYDSITQQWSIPDNNSESALIASSLVEETVHANPNAYAPATLVKIAKKHVDAIPSKADAMRQAREQGKTGWFDGKSDPTEEDLEKAATEIRATAMKKAQENYLADVSKIQKKDAIGTGIAPKEPGEAPAKPAPKKSKWEDPKYKSARWTLKGGAVVTMRTILNTAKKYGKTPEQVMSDFGITFPDEKKEQ